MAPTLSWTQEQDVSLSTSTSDDDLDSIDANMASLQKSTVLVVAPPIFNEALQPWIEYRQGQGYDVQLLTLATFNSDGSIDYSIQTKPVAKPDEIRAKIVKVANRYKIDAILLVGDGAPTGNSSYAWRDVVPAVRTPALAIQIFGSEDLLATDSYYGDLDGDGIPDVPVGRLPVETPEELKEVVRKIIRYERDSPAGNWTRRINVIAGPNGLDLRVIGTSPGDSLEGANSFSGVSAFVDSIVNKMARDLFSEYLPQEYSLSLTQCSLQSVFCPYPPDFGRMFLERANEGSLFLIYLGHGQVLGLDRMEGASGRNYGIFEIDDCRYLNTPNVAPIVFFFACYTGAYDANCRSLAEETILQPNGPVAVYASSRLSAPYGMSVLGASLLDVAFKNEEHGNILGKIILKAQQKTLETPHDDEVVNEEELFEDESESNKETSVVERQESVEEKRSVISTEPGSRLEWLNKRLAKGLQDAEEVKRKNSSFRKTLDRTAALLDPTASHLEDQLRDHVVEFNLLGDPLLRVKFPQRIKIDVPEITYSTKELHISGELPSNGVQKEGVVQAELLLANFRSPVSKPKRDRVFSESVENREEYRKTYAEANKFVVDAVRVKTRNRRFHAKILVPSDFSGECVVRIAATDSTNYYIGSQPVLVRPYSERQRKD